MAENVIEASEQGLFVQENPSSVTEPLTCIGIGDVTIPKGERTIVYCPAALAGKYDAAGFITGEAGPVTLQITRPLSAVYNYLLETVCAGAYRVNVVCPETSRHLVTNYLWALLLYGGEFTTGGITGLMALQPADNARVNTTGDLAALNADFIKRLQSIRQTLTQVQDVNGIDMLPRSCGTKCGVYRSLCHEGYAVLDTDYLGVYGDTVLWTEDGGAIWTPTPTSPFAYIGRNATDVETIVTSGGHRVIVSGGAVPGAPPEIAYSDDGGALWYNVFPEAGLGTANRGVNALAWDARLRLWAAADDGRIYVSTNLGTAWSIAEAGVETIQDLNDIVFYTDLIGYAVGDSAVAPATGAFLRTTDGATWDLLPGPVAGVNLLSVAVNRYGHVFVGTNDARVFRSVDGGVTWEEMVDFGCGTVDVIEFEPNNRYVGYLAWTNCSNDGFMYRTEDGGNTWLAGEIGLTTPANNGIYALAICDANNLFAGGNVHAGTSWIARYSPVTTPV